MKNKLIKKKYEKLIKKALEIENQCVGEIIDFINTPQHEQIYINNQYYHILNN